jgi:dTDP-4-dehydrorhamnose reductase
MKSILVTGGNGQLGQCIRDVEIHSCNGSLFAYLSSEELDITDESNVIAAVDKYNPDYIINCAAYTAVDKAESEQEKAHMVNAVAPGILARISKEKEIILIHISTDFVFGATEPIPLSETMETKPEGIYGLTKLKGEILIRENMDNYFIIRTSWLYSKYKNNFLNTMLRLGKERDELGVVYDQVGTPTYAVDLAGFIMYIINSGSSAYGVYNYSNEGVASWYDFAFEIFKISKISVNLKPITSDKYPTPAKRPSYSVLNKEKAKQNFDITIRHWTTSVAECLKKT